MFKSLHLVEICTLTLKVSLPHKIHPVFFRESTRVALFWLHLCKWQWLVLLTDTGRGGASYCFTTVNSHGRTQTTLPRDRHGRHQSAEQCRPSPAKIWSVLPIAILRVECKTSYLQLCVTKRPKFSSLQTTKFFNVLLNY